MRALFRAPIKEPGIGHRITGSSALMAPRVEDSYCLLPRFDIGISMILVVFATVLTDAAVAGGEAHSTSRTPKQAFETTVQCAAGAAVMAARFPANDTSNGKARALELAEKERKLAISQGAGLSVPEARVEQQIQRAQDKITLAAYRPDHGSKPSDGKINQRVFYPLLDCELSQLGDVIAEKRSENKLKSEKQ